MNLTGQLRDTPPQLAKSDVKTPSIIIRMRNYSIEYPAMSIILTLLVLLIVAIVAYTIKDCLE